MKRTPTNRNESRARTLVEEWRRRRRGQRHEKRGKARAASQRKRDVLFPAQYKEILKSSRQDQEWGQHIRQAVRQRKSQRGGERTRGRRAEDGASFRPKIREKDGTLRLAKSKIDNSAWIKRQVKEGTEKLKFKKTAPTYKQTYEERELSAQMEELTFKPLITSPLTSPDADDSRPDGVDADAIPLRLDTAAEGAASPPAQLLQQ